MFSITCGSCATKLIVRNAAAIGQVLACPRCGEMIRVAAPDGFVPPPSESGEQSSADASSYSAASGLSDFDDISEALLDPAGKRNGSSSKPALPAGDQFFAGPPSAESPIQVTTRPSVTTEPVGRAAANAAFLAAESDRRRESAATAANGSAAPIGGPNGWISAESVRRRKLLFAGIASLVAIAAITGVVLALRKPNPAPIATLPNGANLPAAIEPADHVDEPAAAEVGNQPPQPETPGTPPIDAPASTTESETGDNSTPEIQPAPVGDGPNGIPGASTTQEPVEPPPIEGLDPPANEPDSGQAVQPASGVQRPANQESPLVSSNPGPGDDRLPGRVPVAGMNDSIPDALGELTEILEQQGLSLTAAEGAAASTRPTSRPGLPALLLRKPEPAEPVDLAVVMQLGVGRVVYRDVPHIVVLRELAQLAGVPVVWDLRGIEAAGIDLNQPISVDVNNELFSDAIAEAVDSLGLMCSIQPWGLAIAVPNDGEVASEQFPAGGTPLEPAQLELLAAALPQLVNPPSWALPEPVRSAVVDGNRMIVQQSRGNLRQVAGLLADLSRAPDANSAGFSNRTNRAQVALDLPLQLTPDFGAPLEEFLARVGAKASVTIVIDWSAVAASGWTPLTQVPGRVDAATVRILLEQLCQAMELEWLAVGPRSFLLTTPAAARQIFDVEVYPVGPLLNEQLTSDRLGEILYRAVVAGNPAETYSWTVFDPVSQSLIVSAPQSVQRQITAVLQQLAPPAIPAPPEPERPIQQDPGVG